MKTVHMKYLMIVIIAALAAWSPRAKASSTALQVQKASPALAENDSAKFQGTDFDLLSRKGELMIKRQDMKDIYDALSGVVVRRTDNGNVEIAVDAATVAPSFFVKSVLYFSPANWSVWVNDRKFTPFYNKSYTAKGDVDFEVANVDHDRVRLVWNTHYLDAISPGWRQKLSPGNPSANHALKEPGFISLTGKIFVSQDGNRVEVILAPNQTFVTHTMDVEEGYVAPVTIAVPAVGKVKDNTDTEININPATQHNITK